MKTINVPSRFNSSLANELNNKSIDELRRLFELSKDNKPYFNKISFENHMIYYEFGIISMCLIVNYPSKEVQEKVLLGNIEGFEDFVDYEIKPISLINGDEDSEKNYYFKGKFTNEKQFFLFFLLNLAK